MTQPEKNEGVRVGCNGERVAFGGGGPVCIGDPSIVRAKVREKANKIIHQPDVLSLPSYE